MAANKFTSVNWFLICYIAAAAIQTAGSFNLFNTVGGSILHGIAGAVCLELLILALNDYGAKQAGRWMAFLCTLSLALIGASAMFQAADLLSHAPDAQLAARLGTGYYDLLRVAVPIAPSVAMAIVTLIKFMDAQRSRVDETAKVRLTATEQELQQTQADLAKVVHQVAELVAANERLSVQPVGETIVVNKPKVAPKLAKPKAKPVPQLAAGDTWKAKVAEMVLAATESGTKPNFTHIAATVGKSRTAVADVAKAVLQ